MIARRLNHLRLTLRLLRTQKINILFALVCFTSVGLFINGADQLWTLFRRIDHTRAGFLPDLLIQFPVSADAGLHQAVVATLADEETQPRTLAATYTLWQKVQPETAQQKAVTRHIGMLGLNLPKPAPLMFERAGQTTKAEVKRYRGQWQFDLADAGLPAEGDYNLIAGRQRIPVKATKHPWGTRIRAVENPNHKAALADFLYTWVDAVVPRSHSGIGAARFAVADDPVLEKAAFHQARFIEAYTRLLLPRDTDRYDALMSETLFFECTPFHDPFAAKLSGTDHDAALRVGDWIHFQPATFFPIHTVVMHRNSLNKAMPEAAKQQLLFVYDLDPKQRAALRRRLNRRVPGLTLIDSDQLQPGVAQRRRQTRQTVWIIMSLAVAIAALNLGARLIQFYQHQRIDHYVLKLNGFHGHLYFSGCLIALPCAVFLTDQLTHLLTNSANQILQDFSFAPMTSTAFDTSTYLAVLAMLTGLIFCLETLVAEHMIRQPMRGTDAG